MHKYWIDALLDYPTAGIAVCSLAGDAYVIASTTLLQRLLTKKYTNAQYTHDFIISSLIQRLAIINLFVSIISIPQLVINWGTFDIFCLLVGFLAHFFFILTSLWHIFISSYLLYLLLIDSKVKHSYNKNYKKIKNKNKNKHNNSNNNNNYNQMSPSLNYTKSQNYNKKQRMHFKFEEWIRKPLTFDLITLIFLMISTVGSLIPLAWEGENHYTVLYNYQTRDGSRKYGNECWVEPAFWIIAYAPLMISVVFDIIVLLAAICKYYQTKWFTNAYLALIKRLSVWVIVFIMVRIIPFIERVILFIDPDYYVPLYLIALHNYIYAGAGVANGIVWYFNRRIDSSVYLTNTPSSGAIKATAGGRGGKKNKNKNQNKKNKDRDKDKDMVDIELSEYDDGNRLDKPLIAQMDRSNDTDRSGLPSHWASFVTDTPAV